MKEEGLCKGGQPTAPRTRDERREDPDRDSKPVEENSGEVVILVP